jgi:hypothetical protein
MKWFREMWGIDFESWTPTRWANHKFDTLWAPAYSMLGFSTPKQLWDAISSENLEDGFVNRFVMLEAPHVFVEERTPKKYLSDINDDLQKNLAALFQGQYPPRGEDLRDVAELNVCRRNHKPAPDIRPWGDGAQARWEEFRRAVRLRIHDDETLRRYLARVALNAQKLATIRAGAKQPRNPAFKIELDDVDWAIAYMQLASDRMVAQGRANIGREDTKNRRAMDWLLDFIRQHPDGVSRGDVTGKMSSNFGSTAKDVTEFIKTLEESHKIGVSGAGKRGNPFVYRAL